MYGLPFKLTHFLRGFIIFTFPALFSLVVNTALFSPLPYIVLEKIRLVSQGYFNLHSQHLSPAHTNLSTRHHRIFSSPYSVSYPFPGVRYAHWLKLPTCSLLAQTSRTKPHLVIIGGQSPQDSKGLGQAGDCNEQSRGWRPDRHRETF